MGVHTGEDRTFPFGKYQGKPIHEVVKDKEYVKWLKRQPWFRKEFPDILDSVLVINNNVAAGEDVPTPEHNGLQLRFMDPDFVIKFVERLYQGLTGNPRPDTPMFGEAAVAVKDHLNNAEVQAVTLQKEEIAYVDHETGQMCTRYALGAKRRVTETESWEESLKLDVVLEKSTTGSSLLKWTLGNHVSGSIQFEWYVQRTPTTTMEPLNGSDVMLNVLLKGYWLCTDVSSDIVSRDFQSLTSESQQRIRDLFAWANNRVKEALSRFGMRQVECSRYLVFVEIKPTMGDDYPAVLRQIDRQRQRLDTVAETHKCTKEQGYGDPVFVLFVRDFQSEVCSRKQLKRFFWCKKVYVIFEDELK